VIQGPRQPCCPPISWIRGSDTTLAWTSMPRSLWKFFFATATTELMATHSAIRGCHNCKGDRLPERSITMTFDSA
jgi:hypothetical protein